MAEQQKPEAQPVAWMVDGGYPYFSEENARWRAQKEGVTYTALVRATELAALRAEVEALRAERDAAVAAECERWQKACKAIANDLRNHDMVRLGAAKCLDAARQEAHRG